MNVSATVPAEKTLLSDSNNNELLIINLATVPAEGILFSGLHKCVAVRRNQTFVKVIVTILLLFISFLSFGQRLQDTLLSKLQPFDLANNGNLWQLAGNFTVSDGMGGFTYRLDSSGAFERVDFADIGGSYISLKGTIRLNLNGQLQLVSNKGTSTFDIFLFDTFAFLIKPSKIGDFRKDFRQAVLSTAKKNVYVIGDKKYTEKFMIAFILRSKYLVRGAYL